MVHLLTLMDLQFVPIKSNFNQKLSILDFFLDIIIVTKKGVFYMSKKKKEKIKKLDDETYGAYISALKEETPIKEYTESTK